MKKTAIFILMLTCIPGIFLSDNQTLAANGRGYIGISRVPEVRYIAPKDESEISLKYKKNVIFSWKPTPIPSGGRVNYKFELYKGFGYERIFERKLSSRTFCLEVVTEKFEKGVYSWFVKQRDRTSRRWSVPERWSFTVTK